MKLIKNFNEFCLNELNYIKIHKMEPIQDYLKILSIGEKIEITTNDNLSPVEVIFIKSNDTHICYILDEEHNKLDSGINNKMTSSKLGPKNKMIPIKLGCNIFINDEKIPIKNRDHLIEVLGEYDINEIKSIKIRGVNLDWDVLNKKYKENPICIDKFIDSSNKLPDYIYIIPHNNILISKL